MARRQHRPGRPADPGSQLGGRSLSWSGSYGQLDHASALRAVLAAAGACLNLVRKNSMLRSRIQAGNSSSTQTVRPTLTSNTTAITNPSIPIHLGTTFVRSVMVAVLTVNTAAIRIPYTCNRSEVTWRPSASVSGPGADADPAVTSAINPPAKAAAANSMATN